MDASKTHPSPVDYRRQHGNGGPPEHEEQSVGEIVSGITQDAREFVSLELQTLKLDIRRELAEAKKAAAAGVIGASVAYLGVLILLLALAYAIADAADMPVWAGHAIVGLVLAITAGAFLFMAKSKGSRVELPPPAIEEAKEDIRWIKESSSG
jgi:hypothetical protein